MAGADLTVLNSILKDQYLGPVAEQLNNEVLLLQRLEARDQEVFGRQVITPIHIGRSGGIGARGESKQLPGPGNQRYASATYDLKYLYGRVRVTGPAMARTRSEAGAFLQALKSELDGIRADLRKDVSRQVYGNGDGRVATCGSSGPSTTVTLASREPLDKGQLYVGMVVDIGTSADPDTLASATTITAVNPATPSITIGTSVTVTGSNFVFRSGGVDQVTNAVYEIDNGLGKMVSTTAGLTVGGINSGTTLEWDNLRNSTGGALSLDLMMQLFNYARVAGSDPSLLIGSFGVQRNFWNAFQSKVQYTEPQTLRGGFRALEFNGTPFVADVDAPWGRMYLLDERYLKVFANGNWRFLDEDGNVLKWQTDFDAFDAVLARYMNLGITRRNVQLVASGLTDATGY
jgi:hypothetical protein